jgi:hypothetical protein
MASLGSNCDGSATLGRHGGDVALRNAWWGGGEGLPANQRGSDGAN